MYGTLRPGSQNDQALELAKGARHLGHARIRGRLYWVAHYPGLTAPQGEDEWVTGDVFEHVDPNMFQRLDEYEGTDYIRQLAEVTMQDGSHIAAYLYCYRLPTDGLKWISSGDWLTELPSQPE